MKNLLKYVKLLIHKLSRVAFAVIGALFLPLKNDKITIIATKRKGFACNVKYVAKEIKKQHGNNYEIIWISDYPETCDEIRECGINVKKMNTLSYAFTQISSKFVVYNDSIPSYLPKRKGQIYINTWHGGINYKHIGYDYLADQSSVALKKFAMRNPQPDYFISGSRFFTENTAKSFKFDEKVFMPWGLPRNSVLFDEAEKKAAKEKVVRFYGINGEKILIYAPTFRIGLASDTHGFNFALIAETMKNRFGGEWKIFYRGHGFVEGNPDIDSFVIDATNYADMSELTAAADAMISDYSSAMWDMIFTGKPIFAYVPDIDDYAEHDRNFAYPVEKWPYPIAKNNAQLVEKILSFDENEFKTAVENHLKDAGSYEKGQGAKKVAELIDEISQKR